MASLSAELERIQTNVVQKPKPDYIIEFQRLASVLAKHLEDRKLPLSQQYIGVCGTTMWTDLTTGRNINYRQGNVEQWNSRLRDKIAHIDAGKPVEDFRRIKRRKDSVSHTNKREITPFEAARVLLSAELECIRDQSVQRALKPQAQWEDTPPQKRMDKAVVLAQAIIACYPELDNSELIS